jgi:hypothetical protein
LTGARHASGNRCPRCSCCGTGLSRRSRTGIGVCQCALLPAGRGTVTIAAARLLRCRRARAHYPCVSTGSAAEGVGDVPLASPGARWRREEDEELVAAVRAGADLAVIAEQHGRTRSAIVSRLLRMIPAREAIPEEEQLCWIMARLADPCFDWRTPVAHPRPGRRLVAEFWDPTWVGEPSLWRACGAHGLRPC